MKILESNNKLGKVIPNIGTFLQLNRSRFLNHLVYQEKGIDNKYQGISWDQLYANIENIAFNLKSIGFGKGEKMILFSRNRLEMLELELAIMAVGGIAVPIFANFKQKTAELLINHSDAQYLTIEGQQQLNNISPKLNLKKIFVFDDVKGKRFSNLLPFSSLLKVYSRVESSLRFDLPPDTICLNMYTSGTMGTPKCVQLTHKNILSQQAALDIVWDIDDNDRFLSYLPWHHSFGGLFELFTALYHGATISLESSYGKDMESIMENWKIIKPTIFFSVPKVYQSLLALTKGSKEAEDLFFNSGLKFIFTAAASLPEKISNVFENRGIPVIEGWGLTETSPCCTVTDPNQKRATGVVGKPIPGISIGIAEDDEILIKGPNVMVSYYKNKEANENTFTDDGWYRTGDVGEIIDGRLKLISRKDRIFKLSNGEKVIPTDLERLIRVKCHYVAYAIVTGNGQDHPVALIFPNKNLLENPDHAIATSENCFCPKNINELGRCLTNCLHDANCAIEQKFAKVKSAVIIDDVLSLDNNTLTPSMKVAPNNVIEKYKSYLENLYGDNVPVEEEAYVIELNKLIK